MTLLETIGWTFAIGISVGFFIFLNILATIADQQRNNRRGK